MTTLSNTNNQHGLPEGATFKTLARHLEQGGRWRKRQLLWNGEPSRQERQFDLILVEGEDKRHLLGEGGDERELLEGGKQRLPSLHIKVLLF